MTIYVKDLLKFAELPFDEFEVQEDLLNDWFGFYDWFCQNKVLPKKSYDLSKKIKKLVKGGFINPDLTAVFFKNNCPMVGGLYDDLRFYTLPKDKKHLLNPELNLSQEEKIKVFHEHGEYLIYIDPKHGVFGYRSNEDVDFTIMEFGNWKGISDFLNKKVPLAGDFMWVRHKVIKETVYK